MFRRVDPESDDRFFRLAMDGDDDAIVELIGHHRHHIVAGARRGGYEVGVDPAAVANAARLKIFSAFGQFKGEPSQLGAWMWRIAYNTGISESRKEGRIRQQQVSIEQVQSVVPGSADPEREATNRLFIESLLHQLEPTDRELLELRYFDGYTPIEIARRLHYSPGYVRKRINRILARCEKLAGRAEVAGS